MAVKYITQAFVFKQEDRLDADRIFSVFTKEFGRLEIFAKAIRRIDSKLQSGIGLLSFCEIEFIQGKNKKTLTGAISRERFASIAKDPEKLKIALAISGLVDSFITGQEKDEHILDLILEVFYRLNLGKARKLVYYYFFWNFISLLGYGPEIEDMKVSPTVATVLRLIIKKDWNTLEDLAISSGTQQTFQDIYDHHYASLMELHA